MKKTIFTSCLLLLLIQISNSQTNIFPASGNVGIGITAPRSQLHVSGANLIKQPNGTILMSRYWQNDSNVRASALFHYYDSYDKLAIAVSSGKAPLDSSYVKMVIQANGNVGIGVLIPTEKLSVNGKIRAKELKVETMNWPDYVLMPSYPLMPLRELENFIKENGHLPEMPSAREVAENGVELGATQAALLKKIEELTLHLIEIENRSKQQQEDMEQKIGALQNLVKRQTAIIEHQNKLVTGKQ